MIKHYVLKFRFLQDYCIYENNWCNGKHIPDIDSNGIDRSNIPDKEHCPYYNVKKKRCKHPQYRFKGKGDEL